PDADEQAQTTTETIASAEASCCATEASSEPAKTPAGHSAAEAAPIDAGTESPAVEASAEQPAEPAQEETTEAVSAEPVAEAEPSESQPTAEPEASTETAEATTPSATLASTIELIRFADLDLDARLQQAIAELGFEYATPIQSLALPHTLQGKDVIGKAQTGTGKTAAFLITVLNRLLREPEQEERYNGEPRALILAPTRELAMQIEKDALTLIKHTPLTLMSIVGGMDYQKQQRRLQNEI